MILTCEVCELTIDPKCHADADAFLCEHRRCIEAPKDETVADVLFDYVAEDPADNRQLDRPFFMRYRRALLNEAMSAAKTENAKKFFAVDPCGS